MVIAVGLLLFSENHSVLSSPLVYCPEEMRIARRSVIMCCPPCSVLCIRTDPLRSDRFYDVQIMYVDSTSHAPGPDKIRLSAGLWIVHFRWWFTLERTMVQFLWEFSPSLTPNSFDSPVNFSRGPGPILPIIDICGCSPTARRCVIKLLVPHAPTKLVHQSFTLPFVPIKMIL